MKLTESKLNRIVAESIKRVLKESMETEMEDERRRKENILRMEKERRHSQAMIYFRRAEEEMKKGLSQLGEKHMVEIFLKGDPSFLPIPGHDFKCVGNIRIDGEVVG